MINLKEVITKYPECLESASKLRSYLVDLYPTEKRDIFILCSILECGIAEEIKAFGGNFDDITLNRFCEILEKNFGTSFKVSKSCILTWKTVYEKPTLKEGDTIFFGTYPQGANGEIKSIEWQVLRAIKNQVLIISKYALDCKNFNEQTDYLSWDNANLNKWLNSEFCRKAFGNLNNDAMSKSKVFLLSIEEADEYFASDNNRKCKGTDYCYKQGAYRWDNGCCVWWLRSCGKLLKTYDYYLGRYINSDEIMAAGVLSNGAINRDGYKIDYTFNAVRPALWVDYTKIKFEIVLPKSAENKINASSKKNNINKSKDHADKNEKGTLSTPITVNSKTEQNNYDPDIDYCNGDLDRYYADIRAEADAEYMKEVVRDSRFDSGEGFDKSDFGYLEDIDDY